VYLGPAQKATQTNHAEQLAGRVGLFGVRSATEVGGRQSGQGLTFVLDVTHIIDNMYVNGLLDDDELAVRIVPMKPVRESAQVSIGRVSIYRQGD
jgi:tyrosinase